MRLSGLPVQYAYHATTRAHVGRVARRGLIPQRQPRRHADEQRGVDEPVVFFSSAAKYALVWGDVLLRFPMPEDAFEDPYGDTVLFPDGTIGPTNLFTPRAVPPERIDVRIDGAWVPLRNADGRATKRREPRRSASGLGWIARDPQRRAYVAYRVSVKLLWYISPDSSGVCFGHLGALHRTLKAQRAPDRLVAQVSELLAAMERDAAKVGWNVPVCLLHGASGPAWRWLRRSGAAHEAFHARLKHFERRNCFLLAFAAAGPPGTGWRQLLQYSLDTWANRPEMSGERREALAVEEILARVEAVRALCLHGKTPDCREARDDVLRCPGLPALAQSAFKRLVRKAMPSGTMALLAPFMRDCT